MTAPNTARRLLAAPGVILVLGLLVAGVAGCQLVGAMAASHHRASSHTVAPKYTGLTDKTFAVIVNADRSIQADHPELVITLTRDISRRLAEAAGASGIYPANEVLTFQFQKPNWVAMTPQQIADEFGVDRLIYIDMAEYRLTDPGNPYIWSGVAIGSVSVTEADSATAGLYGFRESVRVKFPDEQGVSPMERPRDEVKLILTTRFVQRVAWLFFEHEESNVIKY